METFVLSICLIVFILLSNIVFEIFSHDEYRQKQKEREKKWKR